MGGKSVKNTIQERLVDIIAPHPCFGCGFLGDILCQCCVENITNDLFYGCFACDQPTLDGICDQHANPHIRAFWVASWRQDALKAAIDGYKFNHLRRVVSRLAVILDARIPVLSKDTVVVPVPTRTKHIRVRGYDHTLLLAHAFAELRGLRVEKALTVKNSIPQHTLNKADRAKGIAGTISIRDNVSIASPVLLVDDIVTTGETIQEAVKTLSLVADIIWVAALAKQPLD